MSSEKELLDRLPPHNREAEQCVLGSMLRDNACIDSVLQIVHKDDFYADAHQKVFETVIQLNDRGGHAVDLVILAEALSQRGWYEDVGKHAYLAELWDAAPTAANAEYYAQIVRDKALVRNLIRAGNEILGEAYKQTMPADQMIEGAERKILEIAQKGIAGQVHTLEQAIADTYDRIDARVSGAEMSASGLPTGFGDALLERYKIRVRQAREARVADLKAMAEQIQKMAGITIEANATPEGHLFGSVGPAEISKGLKAKNLPVDPEMVILEGGHHIKETGLYAVKLALGHEIETEVKVAVIAATQSK